MKTEEIAVEVQIGSRIVDYLRRRSHKRLLLVADLNTYDVFGSRLSDDLAASLFKTDKFIFEQRDNLVPDEQSVALLQGSMQGRDYDVVLAVGSGVINDIVRYTTFKLGLPYVAVATAPSMDGYASNMAAMQFAGLKVTVPTHPPNAIFADLDVLRRAPLSMVQAGFGDLAGKAISLSDWLLSHYRTGEQVCEDSFFLVLEPLQYLVESWKELALCTEAAISGLFMGLINSGVAMAMVGNSRPCSGSEHHCSHFLDFLAYRQRRTHVSHGIQVGYATHWMTKLYDFAFSLPPRERPCSLRVSDEFLDYAHEFYGPVASEVIAAQAEKARVVERTAVLWRDLNGVALNKMLATLLPLQRKVVAALEGMGITRVSTDVSESLLRQTLVHARELRSRYTILDYFAEHGVLEQFVERVLSE